MAEQLWLDGFGVLPPPPPRAGARQLTDAVFLALRPEAAAATRIVDRALALIRTYELVTASPTPADRLHVSLLGLHAPRGDIGGAVRQLTEVADAIDCPPFEAMFDRVMSFKSRSGSRPAVLCSDSAPLLRFYEQARRACWDIGSNLRPPKTIVPHVTIFYDPFEVPEQATEPIGWSVRELVLVHSLTGRGRHEILGRWPLRDRE